jgi:type IX secretion system PorP/SprF family membrane protein
LYPATYITKIIERMKRIVSIASFLLIVVFSIKAQQIEQFSMYMENNYLINPAEAGTTDYVDAKISYRDQWRNLESGAPKSYYISAHSPIGKKRNDFKEVLSLPYHGVGFALVKDDIYSFNRTNLKLSYSYQRPLSQRWTASAGVHAGFQQFQFNSDIIQNVRDRSTVFDGSENGVNTLLPDLSLGLWAHTHNFYIGFASFQLIPSKLNVGYDKDGKEVGALKTHHWLTTGVRIPLDEKDHFNFVPSLVVKGVGATKSTLTADINAKLHYRDHAWIGGSFRYKDAYVTIVGVTIKKMFDIAYSKDWTFSNNREIGKINSNEFLVGMRIANHPHDQAPPPFW